MPAILFWEWMQGEDHMRPLSRVVATIVDAFNKDRARIRSVDLRLTEVDVHDAFEEALENSPLEVSFRHPLNDRYALVAHRDLTSLYGRMHVERPWGKSTRILKTVRASWAALENRWEVPAA